jgi:mevalonate kinase
MRFRTITVLLSTTAILAACSDSATAPSPALESELDEVVLETSASPNDLARAQDRRDRKPPRDRDRLTERQKECIQDAIEAFRSANKEVLDALQAIHQKAREAKAAGATRAEVARILEQAKPLLERLRAAHEALHKEIRACLAA